MADENKDGNSTGITAEEAIEIAAFALSLLKKIRARETTAEVAWETIAKKYDANLISAIELRAIGNPES